MRNFCQISSNWTPLTCSSVDPTYIFGPFVPNYKYIVNHPKFYGLESSNYFVHFLLRPENKVFVVYPGWMDVRDIADAHINAVHNKAIDELVPKDRRFILGAPEDHDWEKVIPQIIEARPHLADRLCSPEKAPVFPMQVTDLTRTEKYLGIKAGSYTSFRKSIVDTIDSILDIEAYWKEQGIEDLSLPNEPLFNWTQTDWILFLIFADVDYSRCIFSSKLTNVSKKW